MNSTMNNNIMMKAFAAMMSGQSPKQFLMDLAKTNPQLQGIDFNNLQQSAQNMCNQRGLNMQEELNKLKSGMSK